MILNTWFGSKRGIIGQIHSSSDFNFGNTNGQIADLAIGTLTLTAGEMSALAAGFRPSNIRRTALVGYWPLDGLSSPEPDLSGNAFNGR